MPQHTPQEQAKLRGKTIKKGILKGKTIQRGILKIKTIEHGQMKPIKFNNTGRGTKII